jgi:hypothetical protein
VLVLEAVSPWLFALSSLLAGGLNLIFLVRSIHNYRALLEIRNGDQILNRISRGFIFIWAFVVFIDLTRVVVGIGIISHQPNALLLLLLDPFGSLLVAVVGLRSFR